MYGDSTSPTGYSYAAGDSSNAVAIAQLESTIAQGSTSSGLQPGASLGSVTVAGVDVTGAAVNSNFSISVPAGSTTVTFNNGTTTDTGALSVGTDPSGNQVVTVDASNFGVRLTLVAPSSMSLSSVLASLNGQSVATASAPSTIDDQYGQQVAALGVDSNSAQNEAQNQQVLIAQLQKQREQTSGVSIDEETTHLIEYQHAYQAAARVVTTADEMLDTLINNTGLVGRG
jgi:flagellar hook-associated protein 1 FlgK